MTANENTPEEGIDGARRYSEDGRYQILVVESDPESLEHALSADFRVHTARDGREGIEVLEREKIALIIAAHEIAGISGVEFLEHSIAIQPSAIRMLLAGETDVSLLTRAFNQGRIYHYFTKPWKPEELQRAVNLALDAYELDSENTRLTGAIVDANAKLRAENSSLRRAVEHRYAFDQIIGASPAMSRVLEVMGKVAETDTPILITGEPGTGKGLVARAIHYAGIRRQSRFIAQSCAALPDTLLESELFGHRRGAFTGSRADKEGMFDIANHGTLFLDEIGETHPGMQVRLIRVLQDGEIRPLGSSDTHEVDVRVIAATSRDLRKEVEEGRFREDLYYLLRVVEITLPPLRERTADIPALARHFLERANQKMNCEIKGFTNAAMDCLVRYRWTGNVAELENEIERTVALAGEADALGVEMLSELIRGASAPAFTADGAPLTDMSLNEAVDALKQRMILDAIQKTGSKTQAAERLGIPRQSLQKMMKRLGLNRS